MTWLKQHFHIQFISLLQTVSAAHSQVRSNPINSAVGALTILVFGRVLAAVICAEKYKFPLMFGDGEGSINYPATADW
ncbi:hypothetical protein B0H13DRAFT_2140472 [Mycena leptocephala]|nr:hypothetical protein B0H13DRAFT_2140472 [Mycena leptocephala]